MSNEKLMMKSVIAACVFFTVTAVNPSCKKSRVRQAVPPQTDSFTVTVNDGYGSGKYQAGDTVHIFSANYSAAQLFDAWGEDVSLLNAPGEWHAWFVMPRRNVTFTGNIKSIPAFTLHLEQIKGKNRLKPVYYYFPAQPRGIVYLLHGTGGSARHLAGDYEWQQLIKALVSNHFGVIITEAEEATMHYDGNGDGKIRWAMLPYDTTENVDYANIRLITDRFYSRGDIDSSLPRYAIGMSDGGFFAAALAAIYGYRAEVNYCAQGSAAVIGNTSTPILFCMARYDSNPQIGPAGNEAARSNTAVLRARGICSALLIKERCPLYPERFARSGDLSDSLSKAVFDELKSKGYLDSRNYFKGAAGDLVDDFQHHRAWFPVIGSLTAAQQAFVTAQVTLSVSDHRMYSDFDAAAVQFLNDPCR